MAPSAGLVEGMEWSGTVGGFGEGAGPSWRIEGSFSYVETRPQQNGGGAKQIIIRGRSRGAPVRRDGREAKKGAPRRR